jgi:hypothetical protein
MAVPCRASHPTRARASPRRQCGRYLGTAPCQCFLGVSVRGRVYGSGGLICCVASAADAPQPRIARVPIAVLGLRRGAARRWPPWPVRARHVHEAGTVVALRARPEGHGVGVGARTWPAAQLTAGGAVSGMLGDMTLNWKIVIDCADPARPGRLLGRRARLRAGGQPRAHRTAAECWRDPAGRGCDRG